MGVPCTAFAYLLAILAPVLLWLVTARLTAAGPSSLGFISGQDKRLSLSRLQAFAWTFLIFGAYVGSMSIHPSIRVPNDERRQAADQAVKQAQVVATAAHAAWDAALVAKNAAHTAGKAEDISAADRCESAASKAAAQADKALTKARNDLRRFLWVTIPSELLALAGISLAGGVFASVISATGTANANVPLPSVSNVVDDGTNITITGANLDVDRTAFRIDSRSVSPAPGATATAVVLLTPPQQQYVLVIDAPAKKFAYRVNSPGGGVPSTVYEWSDLFRDDNDPRIFSIMKMQMFGWTLVALVFFAIIWARNLAPDMDALPLVDSTIVTLTGLSQAGYLGGKAASNLNR